MKRSWNRFFFEFRRTDSHVGVFRVIFFLLVALDAWFQVSHAPRYGAGGFNVPHLPLVDIISPSRELMLILYISQAVIATLIAVGRAPRSAVVLLTTAFGYTYFVSHLNSYQHQWMMFLALVALCFMRWEPEERRSYGLGDWPLRLVLVVTSLVYFWAIVAKVDPLWTGGETVNLQVGAQWARDFFDRMLRMHSPEELAPWKRFAVLVMVTEAALAVAIHLPRFRTMTFVVGVAFHLGIEAVGFKIGLFSYYMVAIYLLVLPIGEWNERIGGWIPPGAVSRFRETMVRVSAVAGHPIFAAGFVALGSCVLALFLPFDESWSVALSTTLLAAALLWSLRRSRGPRARLAAAYALACAAIVILAAGTDTTSDYYRFWGGASRRLGAVNEAKTAYRRLIEVDPSHLSGYTGLSAVLIKSDPERALELCERAKKIKPNSHRGYLCASLVHADAGRGQEAYDNAVLAETMKPGLPSAIRMIQHWKNRR